MKKIILIVLTVITLFSCVISMTSCDPIEATDPTDTTETTDEPDVTAATLKPIIYFYPEEEINCSVKIDLNGAFTCTYPEYKNGWDNFTAKPDGTLIFPDGSEYYALYWEALQNNEYDFSKGFCVKGSETADFLSDVLANPGTVTCGNAGAQGGNHLAALLFEKETGAQLVHIPYSGGGPAITGLLAGEVDCVMANAPEGIVNVQSGQLRILGVFSNERYSTLPEVHTGIEQGVNCVLPQWRTVVVPKDTPDSIVKKLAEIIKQCTEDEAFIAAMTSNNVEVVYKGPAEATAFMKSEDARLAEVCATL